MAIQNYTPIRLPPTLDPILRHELLKVDVFLRQLTPFAARIPSAPQGTPPASGSFDLLNFLFLPGRASGQFSRGRVTFETKIIDAGGTTTNPAQTGVGLTSYSPNDSPTTINLSVEETAVGRTKSPTREWIFPAFNLLDTGPTNGYHYFADLNDYQKFTNKLLDAGNYISLEDTTALGGLYNSTWDRHLAIAWGGSYPAGGFNYAAGFLTTPTGVQPSLQIPSLDYKVQGGASTRDRSHIWCVMKKDHSSAPFEPNSFLYGGATGKELYHMLASAAGLLAAPSQGNIPFYNTTSSLTVTFTLSSKTVLVTTGTTAAIRAGMRVRQTANNYTLTEDTYVESVTDATHFEMTQAWPGSNSTLVTIQVFGPTWENVSAISGSITDVLDSLFRIVDDGDITKKLAFQASGITTATTRTWTIPDFDGTPALFRSNKLRIGDTTAPTHWLELVAGTTTVAPLRLTSGTSLTAAVAGTLEFTTDNLFFTITTGATRKRIVLTQGASGLSLSRVPFATTNGRLLDNSSFTWTDATSLLSALNIVAPLTLKTGASGIGTLALEVVGQAYVSTSLAVGSAAATVINALEVTGDAEVSGGVLIGITGFSPTSRLQVQDTVNQIAVDINYTNTTFSGAISGILMSVLDSFSGVASGAFIGQDVVFNVGSQWTAGTTGITMAGFRFLNSSSFNDVVSVDLSAAIIAHNDVDMPAGAAGSTVALHTGIDMLTLMAGSAVNVTTLSGLYARVGYDAAVVGTILGVRIEGAGTSTGTATAAVAYDIVDNFAADAGVTTWYGLRIPDITGPSTIWGIYQSGTMDSAIAGETKFGATTAPTAWVDIAAGSTARVPLLLASGTLKTTAVAGGIEFLTDDFFATITTGAARKAFILDNGTRLTSGKIPVATTNGRLIDLTASSAYTPTNVTTDRAYDANATTTDELADVLGTLIADLQAKGILG